MRKIVLIDDEEDFCYFVKKNLERTGKFEVITVSESKKGLDTVKREKPDLVLLDILMPGVDGGVLRQSLSEDKATQNIPVIFLTAVVDRADFGEELIKERGGQKFLAKPISPDELIDAINEVLGDEG
jgi:CheY-like chemotaxis protein